MGPAGSRVQVWDPLVRVAHWVLAACIAAAWFTPSGNPQWHEGAGYAALVAVIVRVLWGAVGPLHARFSSFVRSPEKTLGYARLVVSGREPRYLGHNPLGGWMTVTLLVVVGLIALSGWLYTTEAFWGVAWVAAVHEALTYGLLGLVAVHLAGVALASYRHRDNLVAAMLHGRKRAE